MLSIMPKIPDILVENAMIGKARFGVFRLEYSDHLSRWSTHFGIFWPKFAVTFLIDRFFALIWKFGKEIKSGKSLSYWLARFNQKMLFHFSRVIPLISDR